VSGQRTPEALRIEQVEVAAHPRAQPGTEGEGEAPHRLTRVHLDEGVEDGSRWRLGDEQVHAERSIVTVPREPGLEDAEEDGRDSP